MPADEIAFESEEKMEKTVDLLEGEFRAIRTGRATPALVENVKVDYYGAQTPLKQIANIGIPDAQLIVIRPFDPTALKDIEKALLQSSIGITPSNDGKLIRLSIPPLSEERRKQLVQQVKQMAEESKVALRNVRRDANKQIDQEQKGGDLAEDDAYRAKDEIQNLIKEYEGKIDNLVEAKSAEVMTV